MPAIACFLVGHPLGLFKTTNAPYTGISKLLHEEALHEFRALGERVHQSVGKRDDQSITNINTQRLFNYETTRSPLGHIVCHALWRIVLEERRAMYLLCVYVACFPVVSSITYDIYHRI